MTDDEDTGVRTKDGLRKRGDVCVADDRWLCCPNDECPDPDVELVVWNTASVHLKCLTCGTEGSVRAV